jgi:hypothetical protein
MRKLTFTLFLLAPLVIRAQVNLVHNGSFEQYSSCPTGIDQIRKAMFWNTIDTVAIDPFCTPEYCNACADAATTGIGIPLGSGYNHYPRTGNGMVESNMYFDNSFSSTVLPSRNYTQGKLSQNLIAGKNYCVTFYVTLCQISLYACDHIGAYLDNGSIDSGQDTASCAQPQTAFTPQIIGATIINDTLNWVKIQGSFIAIGTEKFITIGNFFDAAHTDTFKLNNHRSLDPFSPYLIDDVSVIESNAVANAGNDMHAGVGDTVQIGTSEEGMPCTWYALGDTTPIGYGGGIKIHPTATGTYKYVVMLDLCGHITYDTMTLSVWPSSIINAQLSIINVQIYPNPARNEVTVQNAKNCEVVFYDVVGRAILNNKLATTKETIDISDLAKGIYSVQVLDKVTGVKVVRKLDKE